MPAPITYPDTYVPGETGVFNNIDILGLASGRHSTTSLSQRYSSYGAAVATVVAEALVVATKKAAHQS